MLIVSHAITSISLPHCPPGTLVSSIGIAIDPNTRNIFVAETHNDRVQKFSPNFVFIKSWGSRVTGDGQFRVPEGIAIDSNGDIYVTDTK